LNAEAQWTRRMLLVFLDAWGQGKPQRDSTLSVDNITERRDAEGAEDGFGFFSCDSIRRKIIRISI
jgi:hypothetical protein